MGGEIPLNEARSCAARLGLSPALAEAGDAPWVVWLKEKWLRSPWLPPSLTKKTEKRENLRAFPLSSDDQKNLEVGILPSRGGSRPSVCPPPHRPGARPRSELCPWLCSPTLWSLVVKRPNHKSFCGACELPVLSCCLNQCVDVSSGAMGFSPAGPPRFALFFPAPGLLKPRGWASVSLCVVQETR